MRTQEIPATEQAATRMTRSITAATVVRFGLSGALAMALIFILSWAAAQLPYGPTPLLIEIFTYAPPATTDALMEGVLVAALVGFVGAAILGAAYAAFDFIDRLGASPE